MTKKKENKNNLFSDGYIMPDGEFLSLEMMEKKLLEDVENATTQEECEEAKLVLASFYLNEAEPLKSLSVYEDIRATTNNQKTKDDCEYPIVLILRGCKELPSEDNEEEMAGLLSYLAWYFGQRRYNFMTASRYAHKVLSLPGAYQEKADCYLLLGLMYENRNQYDRAADAYMGAFSLPQQKNETWYFLNNNLGYSLVQVGRFEEAEKYCRQAIEIDPARHNAHKNLGLSLQGQGKYTEAAMCFVEATKLEPSDTRALNHLQELLDNHPEVADELSGLKDELGSCRELVEQAAKGRGFPM